MPSNVDLGLNGERRSNLSWLSLSRIQKGAAARARPRRSPSWQTMRLDLDPGKPKSGIFVGAFDPMMIKRVTVTY